MLTDDREARRSLGGVKEGAMQVLRLRGQSLSVLISALYLLEGGAPLELELAREDVLQRQMVLQGMDRLTSLMCKAVGSLLTQEWEAFRVAGDGEAVKMPGRVALFDSAQALIELDQRGSVRITDASGWSGHSMLWLPDLEDWRLEAKVVFADGLNDLREPIAVETSPDDPKGTYGQYIPLGGSQTMFVRYRRGEGLSDAQAGKLAETILDRLRLLEEFILAET
jgi:hypothetical protein